MTKVSIIVPVYNVESRVGITIESLLMQTFKDFELILINDGSTDNSLNICQKYEAKDKRIKIINQPNMGSGMARNSGLKLAKGDYIYFSDADDYVEPDLLYDNLIIAEKNNANLVVFGHFDEFISDNGKKSIKQYLPSHNDMYTKNDFRLRFGDYYEASADVLWNKIYKRDFLISQDILFTNQKIGQDALFNLLVYKDIDKVFFNPNPYYHYVYREGSAVNTYRPIRFECEYNISKEFEKLIKYWEMEKKYNYLVNHRYWSPIYSELKGFALKDCSLSYKEKVNRLSGILKKSNIKQAIYLLKKDNNLNSFSSFILKLLSRDKLFLSILLFDLRFS